DNITIAGDGTVSARLQGAPENAIEEVGRLKLVKPENDQIKRREDGLFELKSGEIAQQDLTVGVKAGMLEGSNVNAVDEMVNMISLQRHYEMQVKLMRKADTLATRGNMLLRII
ncbi:MAG: flagellar hook-basal body complex protein, partial [Paraglaciecola chathamensis]